MGFCFRACGVLSPPEATPSTLLQTRTYRRERRRRVLCVPGAEGRTYLPPPRPPACPHPLPTWPREIDGGACTGVWVAPTDGVPPARWEAPHVPPDAPTTGGIGGGGAGGAACGAVSSRPVAVPVGGVGTSVCRARRRRQAGGYRHGRRGCCRCRRRGGGTAQWRRSRAITRGGLDVGGSEGSGGGVERRPRRQGGQGVGRHGAAMVGHERGRFLMRPCRRYVKRPPSSEVSTSKIYTAPRVWAVGRPAPGRSSSSASRSVGP